jgi:DNA-binding transcriptional LysR family regulator
MAVVHDTIPFAVRLISYEGEGGSTNEFTGASYSVSLYLPERGGNTMPRTFDWLSRSRLSARQLALLIQLDEKGSVLRAAEAANLTQPAASKVLSQIEQALGVPLFARHPRGIEPTPYGAILVRHARNVLAELRQAHDELEAARLGVSGEVTVGTVITAATTLVPQAVVRLGRRSPLIQVRIELDFSEVLVRRLVERKLDIVIARLHTSQGTEDLRFEAIAEEAHQIVARTGHPLATRSALTLADLADQTWILPPPGNVMRDRLNEQFLQAGLDLPRHVVETPSLPVIVSLLRDSQMLAPLATEVIRPYCEADLLAPLPVTLDLRLGLGGIITLRRSRPSPAGQAMLDALRETAEALGKAMWARPPR